MLFILKKSSLLFFILIAVFGFLVSSLTLYFILDLEKTKSKALLREKSLEIKDAINLELDKTETILKGSRGFFHSSDVVTRKEFQLFCENFIDEDFPLLLIEWQPKVPESERVEFVKQARAQGQKDFQLFELDKNGEEIPAKKRAFHFPVFYSYSPERFSDAIGLDLAFSPQRMGSKFQSMKLGKAVASGSFEVILKDSSHRKLGFALTYPVFNEASISSSQSLKHLKGFLAIVLYLNDFFEPIERDTSLKNFAFEVIDRADKGKTLFRTRNYKNNDRQNLVSVSVNAGDRLWDIRIYPNEKLIIEQRTFTAYVIWSLMILLSFGLSYYLYLKADSQEKLNSYQRQLQQKQKLESIGVWASGIAHEFNNILHCIRLAGDNLGEGSPSDIEREARDTILDYCKRGRNLVREILSFSRQDSGTREDFDPKEQLKKTVDLMRSTFWGN
jgi:CHASE1-domain containing sensor protein